MRILTLAELRARLHRVMREVFHVKETDVSAETREEHMDEFEEPFLDLDGIAELLDLSPARIRQLVEEGVLPKNANGTYPRAGCASAYIHYLKKVENSAAAVADAAESKLRARLKK
jgi:hypothetical protein